MVSSESSSGLLFDQVPRISEHREDGESDVSENSVGFIVTVRGRSPRVIFINVRVITVMFSVRILPSVEGDENRSVTDVSNNIVNNGVVRESGVSTIMSNNE